MQRNDGFCPPQFQSRNGFPHSGGMADLAASACGVIGPSARRREVPPAGCVARGQVLLAHPPLRSSGRETEADRAPPEPPVDPIHRLHQAAVLQRPVLEQRSNRIAGRRQVKQHHAGLAVGKALPPEALEYSQRRRDDNAAVGGWRRERCRCGSRVLRGGAIEPVSRDGQLQIAANLIGLADLLRRPYREGYDRVANLLPIANGPTEASRTAGGLFGGGLCLQFMTGDAAQLVHRPEPGHAHALAHPAIGRIAQVQRGPNTAPGQHPRPAAADAPDIARGGPGKRRADPGGVARQVKNPARPWRAFRDPVGDLGQGLGRADPDRYRDAGPAADPGAKIAAPPGQVGNRQAVEIEEALVDTVDLDARRLGGQDAHHPFRQIAIESVVR